MESVGLPVLGASESLRVLVTGGAGFLGSHFVDRLLAMGASVTVLDDFSTGLRSNLPADRLASERLRVVSGSVLDDDAVESASRDCNLVMHLASVVGMRRAHAHPAHALRVSDEGTAKILAATDHKPILLMSSSAVYGLDARPDAHEEDPILEPSLHAYDGHRPGYACGKAALERHGRAAMARGRAVLMIRPFNVIGPRQRDSFGMVLPNFVMRGLASQPLEIHGDGLQTRSFGDARTFVEYSMRLMANAEAWRPENTPVNVGTTRETSVLDLAKMVIDVTASSAGYQLRPYEQVFPGKQDVQRRRPDLRRLHRLVGPLDWPELRDVVRDYVDQARGR
jgi:UDP-glucose 4-epimerase